MRIDRLREERRQMTTIIKCNEVVKGKETEMSEYELYTICHMMRVLHKQSHDFTGEHHRNM